MSADVVGAIAVPLGIVLGLVIGVLVLRREHKSMAAPVAERGDEAQP